METNYFISCNVATMALPMTQHRNKAAAAQMPPPITMIIIIDFSRTIHVPGGRRGAGSRGAVLGSTACRRAATPANSNPHPHAAARPFSASAAPDDSIHDESGSIMALPQRH
eukprot:scaffold3808_cov112-Isochrysis_galbana.AAC.36